jgi:chitin synthase
MKIKMNLTQQKYLILFIIGALNFLLIYTFVIFHDYWYAYLPFLIPASLLNAFSSILNVLYKMCGQKRLEWNNHRSIPRSYLYVVPCYNESFLELQASLHSLIEQRLVTGDRRLLLIICDGKVKGAGNDSSTDVILKDLLKIKGMGYYHEYTTWDGSKNIVCEYKTMYTHGLETVPIILLIKENNYGKRDSLVLARRICYAFNRFQGFHNSAQSYVIRDEAPEDSAFLSHFLAMLAPFFPEKIDYIIGIDADTVFDYNCTYELIQGIEIEQGNGEENDGSEKGDNNVHGCVGFVDVHPDMTAYSPFVLYQYAEYVYAQCLRRQAQANITNKVSCLSGCNQILRVSEETCGEKILKLFNYKPIESDNILTHIRSYASEDRNHVCNMLSLYPYVKTTQSLKAVAYTIVPTSFSVFLSQRRRWNLGANTNDLLLIYLPGINIFERILAFVNVLTFILTPFIFVATVYFVMAIITEPTLLMLYLSIILFFPLFHSFLVPLFIKPLSFRGTLYYYGAYIYFICLSGLVSLICFCNALLKMDILTWGKTRAIDTNQLGGQNLPQKVVLQLANEVESNEVESNEVESNEVESNEVESNEVESNNEEVVTDTSVIVNATDQNSDQSSKQNKDQNKVEERNIKYVDVEIDTSKLDLCLFILDTDL